MEWQTDVFFILCYFDHRIVTIEAEIDKLFLASKISLSDRLKLFLGLFSSIFEEIFRERS